MFANQHIFLDSKENVKASNPTKPTTYQPRKGLKSCSLNSFNATNENKIKKNVSETYKSGCKLLPEEKENSKPKIKNVKENKTLSQHDDWSDIEDMHICVEPDDDYGDIVPESERINDNDIDSLFMSYTYTNCFESPHREPSPLPGLQNMDFPGWSSPFPKIQDFFDVSATFPKIEAPLYDDTPLDIIPFPDDLFS